MLYLIGLGLNLDSLSKEASEALNKVKKIYLEDYTVDFPYLYEELEKSMGKKLFRLGRKDVESDFLINEAKKQDIALLIYGSPLFATTHLTLILDAKKQKVKVSVLFNASVFDAISLSGLQLYKFGKIASMPAWQKSFTPTSFLDIVKENISIKAHSLILIDIGLAFDKALEQLESASKDKDIILGKIVVCSSLGTKNQNIFYDSLDNLRKIKKVDLPFCLIIPGELHFMEKEALESL
jgi:diphthine synthase